MEFTPGGLEVVAHTTILMGRHGLADMRSDRVGPDRGNPGLAEQGHVQARALAEGLAAEPVDAVYCSPLRRAVETAEPVCARLGLELHRRDGLAEFDRKADEYVLLSALKQAGDPRYDACMAGDLSSWGMDLATFRAEALDVLAEIVRTHAGGRVLVITHGGVLNAVLGHLLGIDRMWFFHPVNAGYSRVAIGADHRVRLDTLNESRHLPAG